jgi:hypothetical protein
VAEPSEFERDLHTLEAELRRLETEYNTFFSGRAARPPSELRARVEQLVKRLDRQHVPNYGDRFRFTTLQARHSALVDLWDRAIRAREEGRPGPFTQGGATAARGRERLVHETAFREPRRELDKLQDLYERLAAARRNLGEEAVVPFHKFAELVTDQVARLKRKGSAEVTFRVAVKDGKVRLTAKGLRKGKP